ncbi:MAG: fasciclin domain-containing protein, partial [Methanosarcinaceae archaeon]
MASCAAAAPDGENKNIAEAMAEDGNFIILSTAFNATSLNITLSENGSYTVFAPTDEAFAALPEGTLEALLNDTEALTEILLYHVVDEKLMEADLVNLTEITTLQGSNLTVDAKGSAKVLINEAEIIISDIETSNGVIHVIDAVLIPPEEEEGPDVRFDDDVVLIPGNFTFVPSNNETASYELDNFTDIGALNASELSFNASDEEFNETGAFILESIDGIENNATRGEFWFIFINDELAPEDFGLNTVNIGDNVKFLYTLDEGGDPVIEEASYEVNITIVEPEPEPEEMDIIETAEADGNFTALLAALNATNLTDALKGDGPFTVFAPTDDAFAALPNETIEALQNDTEALSQILLYHVADGKLMAEDVANLTNITTLQGSNITVNVTEDGRVFVDEAEIIVADVEASNGVIHVIDAVLVPPEEPEPEPEPEEMDIIETAEADGNFTALLAALNATNLTDALKGDGPFTVFAPTDDAFAALPNETIEALQNDTEALSQILLYHV